MSRSHGVALHGIGNNQIGLIELCFEFYLGNLDLDDELLNPFIPYKTGMPAALNQWELGA